MKIAVYVPSFANNQETRFTVETFFPLFRYTKGHEFFLITTKQGQLSFPADTNVIFITTPPRSVFLKRIWIEKKLAGVLKKLGADLFICADNFCSLKVSLPQCILMPYDKKVRIDYIKKARLLLVISNAAKQELIAKYGIEENKIIVVYPFPAKAAVNFEAAVSIKNKYSEGKEYFLLTYYSQRREELIELLKSFSQFKKRQQSSFKLLILVDNKNLSPQKIIDNYKYRHDVIIVRSSGIETDIALVASAYALLLPFAQMEDVKTALNAMQSGVPVLATKNSPVGEFAGDAVMYSGHEVKDIAENMMQLYKDEGLRTRLIEKGKKTAENFTEEKSADWFWLWVLRAMN